MSFTSPDRLQLLHTGFNEQAPLALYACRHARKMYASMYYRIEVPLRGLYTANLASVYYDQGEGNRELALGEMFQSDIALFHGARGGAFDPIHAMNTLEPRTDATGRLKFPPSPVFDLDDDIEHVHPFNYAFVELGVCDLHGNKLEPGKDVLTELADGTIHPLWQDKVTRSDGKVFDIARNLQDLERVYDFARRATGVTVPSPYLAEIYRAQGCENVYVFPNTVIPEDYPHRELVPHEGVRVLWQGGASHITDWFDETGCEEYPRMIDALRHVAERNPHVTFVFFGQHFPAIVSALPPEQVEFHDWVDFRGYSAWRTLLDIDINLCVLSDTVFNRSKSPIKWYEASLSPYAPEATLAAKVTPYKEEIVDGETGILYDGAHEFVQKLQALIDDRPLRQSLGEAARQWVLQNRTCAATIPGLYEFYQECRSRTRKKFLTAVGV